MAASRSFLTVDCSWSIHTVLIQKGGLKFLSNMFMLLKLTGSKWLSQSKCSLSAPRRNVWRDLRKSYSTTAGYRHLLKELLATDSIFLLLTRQMISWLPFLYVELLAERWVLPSQRSRYFHITNTRSPPAIWNFQSFRVTTAPQRPSRTSLATYTKEYGHFL